MNDKLTIVLFLKGREPYTLRWLEYMNEARCPFKILIGDGSDSDFIANHMKQSDYPNLHYDYLRFPPDKTLDEYYTKAEETFKRIKTDYSVLVDNDDFLSLENLKEQVRFLEQNVDYVCCGGPTVFFESLGGQTQVGNSEVLFSGAIGRLPNDCENTMERVVNGVLNYDCYLWYNVTRASAAKNMFAMMKRIAPKNVFLSEYLWITMTPLLGKVGAISNSSYYRQLGTSQVHSTPSLVYNTYFIVTDINWSGEYDAVHREIHALYGDLLGKSYDDFLLAMRQAFATLLNGLATPVSPPWYTAMGESLGLRGGKLWNIGRGIYSRMHQKYAAKKRIDKSNYIIRTDAVAKSVAAFMRKESEWGTHGEM